MEPPLRMALFTLSIALAVIGNAGWTEGSSLKWQSFNQKAQSTSGKESWGYVTVRPKAHMFYWLYETTHPAGYEKRPLILWLQGGPGGSGTGFGNFAELGPLDTNLKPRNTTWLQTASLLFVDNPVGTGFSYVTAENAYTTNLQEICDDLLVVMTEFTKSFPAFQKTPFYIFSESYGGKMTAGFSAVLYSAIKKGTITMNFQGLAMGDSWISPVDSTNSWGPYLYATSIISWSGLERIGKVAKKVEDLVNKGEFTEATKAWNELEDVVEVEGSGVNFYNILQWQGSETKVAKDFSKSHIELLFDRHVGSIISDDLDALMNGPIRKKLKIIPDDVEWGGQSGDVFKYQSGDFMRNVTSTVNDLINNTPLKVVVYSGQLDLICDVLGTESWFFSLDVGKKFKSGKKKAYPCDGSSICYFGQELGNVQFYWILNAGHMVPQDNGPGALAMVNKVIE
ncbi:retinoid-inducible serine carboxypeptidase [Aplysia californica]|uniref:Carboxypeptidase n=1 Tax=Aplysia californica TaxID=6500 RepID=A0ABM1A9U7_APLCA|nr:retinoid-inducible serine carboxypeptidase [Aplysia californica]